MFKSSILCLAAVGFLATANVSNANLYWDLDVFSSSEGYVSANGSPLTGTFDITGSGVGKGFVGTNDGGSETVDWAFFEFTLADDKDPRNAKSESWEIDLGNADFKSGGSILLLDLAFDFGNASLRADVQADGKVDYSISAISGDFRVVNALMKIGTDEISSTGNRVPDGGLTLTLLGGGVLGLYALRRRI